MSKDKVFDKLVRQMLKNIKHAEIKTESFPIEWGGFAYWVIPEKKEGETNALP